MKTSTIILIVVYVALAILCFYGSYNFTVWGTNDSLKNFAAVVTVCLAAVSAVMGSIIGFFSLHKSQIAATELEGLKSDLQVKVLSQKIWTDLRFEFEKMKATAEGSAYAKLWTAIDSAYLSLAKLEASTWTPADKVLMDQVLREAHGQLINARSAEHRTLWEKARQRAIFISEEAAKISATKQPELWKKNVAEFADLCGQFKDIAQKEINRPPPTEEPKPA